MTLSETIELIEKAMEGATPGVWDIWEERTPTKADAIAEMAYQVENTEPFSGAVFLLNADGKCPAATGCGPTSAANAAYIATCSPDRMRSVLSAARKAEALKREIAEKDARIKRLLNALMAAYEEFNRIACEDITVTRSETDVIERVHLFANRGATDIRTALSATHITDSAETGGSATSSKGISE